MELIGAGKWYPEISDIYPLITSLVVELCSLLLPVFSPTQYLALLISIKQLENLSFYKLLGLFFGVCA